MTNQTENTSTRSSSLFNDKLKKGIADIEHRISDLRNFDLSTITELGNIRVTELKNKVNATISDIFDFDTVEYNENAIWSLGDAAKKTDAKHSVSEVRNAYQKGINDAIVKLLSTKTNLQKILKAIQQ